MSDTFTADCTSYPQIWQPLRNIELPSHIHHPSLPTVYFNVNVIPICPQITFSVSSTVFVLTVFPFTVFPFIKTALLTVSHYTLFATDRQKSLPYVS